MQPFQKKGALVWCKDGDSWWSALLISQDGRSKALKVFIFGTHTISHVPENDVQDFVEHFDEHVAEGRSRGCVFKEGVVEALVELHLGQKNFTLDDVINLKLNDFPARAYRIPKWVQVYLNDKKMKKVSKGQYLNGRSLKRAMSDFEQREFNKGSLVWGKFGKSWWAAVVLTRNSYTNKDDKYKVMWLNDFTTSVIESDEVLDFVDNFQTITDQYMKRMSETWRRGTINALGELYNKERKFTHEDLERFVKEGLNNLPVRIDHIPTSVQNALEKKHNNFKAHKKTCPKNYKGLIRKLLSKGETLVDVRLCLGCYADDELCHEHPLFVGDLCKKCFVSMLYFHFI
ncbi:uncharacterized protein LOC116162246 isoform X2 [Photinus pyralis]|nr:uncharacterized protein LOC116162246 isoform X2 [Photinus pyralis]